jgi:assimilatory nitrate reductase electron transfer subunit
VDAIATRVHGADTFESVELNDGQVISADLLVVACGVVPETALAQQSGLEVDRGVVVDDSMRTSDPDVYAIGECAQHAGQVYGLVAPAWEQATVLADVLSGASDAPRYTGSRLVTRLKAAGVELAAMGDVGADVTGSLAGGDDEVLQFIDPARGTYKKVVIRDGRIAGAILVGDVATAGALMQLFDRGAVVPPDRLTLLFAGLGGSEKSETPARIPDRATICRCNGVTKGAITACWLAGARSTDDVVERTRATTGCGTCRDTVDGIVRWLIASDTEKRSDCA